MLLELNEKTINSDKIFFNIDLNHALILLKLYYYLIKSELHIVVLYLKQCDNISDKTKIVQKRG